MSFRFHLTDPGPTLTPAEIEAFEREIGGRLPEDYKQFLLASNGGFNEPPLGLDWNGRPNTIPDFRRLLDTDESGLRRALRNLRELGVDGYLPVTSTRNGEDICMAYVDNIGSVWVAIYSYEHDVPVSAKLVPLAKSFTEFVNSLVEIPEPYCRIEDLGKNGTEADLEVYLTEGNSIDAIGKNHMTIVREAIKFNNRPMIEACIARGASLSKTVYQAVVNDRPEMVKRLVSAGADVNEKDEFGDPPIYYAVGTSLPGEEGARNRAMLDLLLQLGAQPVRE